MKKMNKARKISSPLLRSLIDVNSHQYRMVERRMRLAGFIADLIEKKGWTKCEFAEKVGKQPSVISKWLSGTHNFTFETLSLIEEVVGVTIVNTEMPKSMRETKYLQQGLGTKAPIQVSFKPKTKSSLYAINSNRMGISRKYMN